MDLKIIGSSSRGNSYILDDGKDILILELGVPFSLLKQKIDFQLNRIVACLVTHSHLDHSKSVPNAIACGITVMSSVPVFESHGCALDKNAKVVFPGKGYKAGNFKIIPFEVNHDVYCLGYLINHPDSGNILFITDSFMCEHQFSDINHAIVECNYSDEILAANIERGSVPGLMKPRLMSTHMELKTCKLLLHTIKNENLHNIILVHLSDGNSDEKLFVSEISGEFGINTIAADKEQTISLDLIPY
jgi:phosphoribosyl 1,2-cyclic phosphodiesterase